MVAINPHRKAHLGGTDNITVVVTRLCEQTNQPCEEEAEAATSIDAPVQKTADTDRYIMPVKLGPPA